MSILDKIVPVKNFANSHYYTVEYKKTQICLHHTVSGEGVEGDLDSWRKRTDRVNTCIIISRDGTPYQCYPSKYWGYHIGASLQDVGKVGLPYCLQHSQFAIGVELDSWGGLTKKNGIWYSSGNTMVKDIVEYPSGFRGFYAFEKYTDEQIQSFIELCKLWNERYGIELKFNGSNFDLNKDALKGTPGIYTHVNYRSDKSDCHPQKELIQALMF